MTGAHKTDLVVYREWIDKHGLRRAERVADYDNVLVALDRIIRECAAQTRGTTHYDGCAVHHPWCRVYAFAQDAIKLSPPFVPSEHK